ncbi:hypothetical protein ACOMHN_050599 [Nucella lapillus]
MEGSVQLNETSGQLNETSEKTGQVDSVSAAFTYSLQESRQCNLTRENQRVFPRCQEKLEWMVEGWKADPCYSAYGVDGSNCSFLFYLSEVETWCPKKRWTNHSLPEEPEPEPEMEYTNVTTSLQGLLDLLKDPNERQGYAWIRLRVARLWLKWVQAIHSLTAKQDLSKRTKHKILVHPGILSKKAGLGFAELQFKGGPLGELVQWSDLISALYILGHQLTITSEVEQLVQLFSDTLGAPSSCPNRKKLPQSLIYTDIIGLRQIKNITAASFTSLSCMFRIADSFGTEPAFNHRAFAKQNKILTAWGGWT